MMFHAKKNSSGPAMLPGQGSAQSAQNRAKGEPEGGVADAGERAHHTDLDALNGDIVNRGTVGALLLESEGNANDGGGNIGVGVIELQVALKSGNLVILAGVELLDRRDHCEAPAAVLHTLVVPRALKELMTEANLLAVSLGELNLVLCHMYHSPPTRNRSECRRAGRRSHRPCRHPAWPDP